MAARHRTGTSAAGWSPWFLTSDVGDFCGGADNAVRYGDLDVIIVCDMVLDDSTDLCR